MEYCTQHEEGDLLPLVHETKKNAENIHAHAEDAGANTYRGHAHLIWYSPAGEFQQKWMVKIVYSYASDPSAEITLAYGYNTIQMLQAYKYTLRFITLSTHSACTGSPPFT